MPLPQSTVSRERLHQRRIAYDGWQRDDGLFDIDAHIVDSKDRDYTLASGVRPAGVPVHDMWVRITIDRHGVIQAIDVRIDGVPYAGGCDRIAPGYASLVGANLMQGFRKALYDAAGGVHGCTHITELIAFLPTAAMQMFATLRSDVEPHGDKPFQLGRCHALETSTDTVRRYYPRWYREPAHEHNP